LAARLATSTQAVVTVGLSVFPQKIVLHAVIAAAEPVTAQRNIFHHLVLPRPGTSNSSVKKCFHAKSDPISVTIPAIGCCSHAPFTKSTFIPAIPPPSFPAALPNCSRNPAGAFTFFSHESDDQLSPATEELDAFAVF
jgi:hypothetical protein